MLRQESDADRVYILPFWSFRPVGNGSVIVHHVTRRTAAVPAGLMELLEGVHTGRLHTTARVADADTLLARAVELDLLFPSKRAADAWMDGTAARQTAAAPVIDQIELTNRCPYTCTMCPRTLSMDRPLGFMRLDLFRDIVEQIAGRQDFVALHHFGESLLHPRLPEAVALARERGLRTGLSCNPPSMRPALARRLLEAGIANVLFSMDSLEPATYREIRGMAARVDLADKHLREIVRLRDQSDYDTSLTLQMINMRANQAEANRFLEYCADVGVDRGVVIRLGRWDFDDDKAASLGDITSPGYGAPCSLPWNSMAVLWDGRVVPCCHDYNGAVVLGDLTRDRLDDIWQRPAAVAFRRGNDESELCRRCAFGKWYREQQREREGFLEFHRERPDGAEVRKEWLNPVSLGWRDGRRWFDRYDVVVDET